ncbi:hypothetical protein PPYR_02690 [Photinus pyralis]|uniref:Uncharacterized protein n=1 Tax=Photinus pyralis TaxID=7054 RepID=A0A1Y1M0M2_PHOPY|nr:uncharacterized protein LOC116159481 isoform X2 [Photinus pyralis]XP_031328319.1 uncharacterized protein LOC116159481 isoform X2 [Photinus pyralis]KAB0805720.1 hypothetical protein PPYR_02690 [Photinus pyralis]
MGDPLSNYGWFDDLAHRSKREGPSEGAIPPIGPSERRGTIAALSGLFRSSVGNSGATGIQGFLSTSNASGSNQLKPVENAPTLSTVPAPTTNQNATETSDSGTKYRTHRSFSLF